MVEDFFEDHIFWAFTSWEIVVGVAVGMFGFLDAADSKWLPIEQMLTLLKPMILRSAKKAEIDCCDGYLKRKGILAATSRP